MIKSFEIENDINESIFLDIYRPQDTGLVITSVSGLSATEIELETTEYAYFDGADLSNIRAEPREIEIVILFYEDNTEKLSIEEIRHRCYRYFPLKKEITFKITNDSGTYSIKGYVEKREIMIFTKREMANITLKCLDPVFRKEKSDLSEHIRDVTPLFEFPVSFERTYFTISENEAEGYSLYTNANYTLEENNRRGLTANFESVQLTQEFGEVKQYPTTIIDYRGDGPQNVTIVIEIIGDISDIRINNVTRKEYIFIDSEKIRSILGSHMRDGDVITITTQSNGRKSVILDRAGTKYNILNSVNKASKWIYLQTGENAIGYTVTEGYKNAKVWIEYEEKYFGV